MFNKNLIRLAERITEDDGFDISHEEGCRLAALPDAETINLIACADKIRRKFKGNRVFACSITNAKSGLCTEDCAFCAQSGHHETDIKIHPLLSVEELAEEARCYYEGGATQYSMVTSGYLLTDQEIETINRAAEVIGRETPLTVCASLGILTEERAERLRKSGITSYHHNLETAGSYFSQICTTHDYKEDLETVGIAKAAGFRVCSGGIMGLGETWQQRVELAITLRELDVDSIPINFLNPIAGTRMAQRPLLSPLEALKCIALFRFLNPTKDITICGGREATLRDMQSWIFVAGANGLMVGNYLTTQGRDINTDVAMIKDLGLMVEKGV